MKTTEFNFSFFTGGINVKNAKPVNNFSLKELIEYYKGEANQAASKGLNNLFKDLATATDRDHKEGLADLITATKNQLPYFMAGGTFQ